MSEQSYCFEKATDNLDSSIMLPISQLHLNSDNTFYISSDDPQLAQIKGEWDLCCYWSEYGNYVFKIDGMKDWKQANPDFFVMRDGKKIRLFYKICN